LETRRDNEFIKLVSKDSSLGLSPEQRFAKLVMR
jgi:hypothetical protein